MKISEMLTTEHKQITRFLRVMESMCHCIQPGSIPDPEHLDIIIKIMETFIGNYHHSREEHYLFPSIPDFNAPAPFSTFFLINAAHSIVPGYINDISRIIRRVMNQGKIANPEIYDATQRFSRLLMSSIRRENDFLEVLDAYLLPQKQDDLLYRFESLDRSINKSGEMERLLQSIDDLEKIYCS